MGIPVDKVYAGLAQFFAEEIMPKMLGGGGMNPFLAGCADILVRKKGPEFIQRSARPMLENPWLKEMDIILSDGSVDMDLLYQTAKEQLSKMPEFTFKLPPPLGTITLQNADIERLNALCR